MFMVTGRARHALPAGPAVGRAVEGAQPGWCEKAPAGVEPDECPRGLGNAQSSARPPGGGGQNGLGVAEQVAGAGKRVEHVCVEPDQLLRSALPEPVEMSGVAGATQPSADGGR